MENDVDVLDIKRLSNEEWNSQAFYISILLKTNRKKCVNQTFGHKTRFYKQRRSTKQDNNEK